MLFLILLYRIYSFISRVSLIFITSLHLAKRTSLIITSWRTVLVVFVSSMHCILLFLVLRLKLNQDNGLRGHCADLTVRHDPKERTQFSAYL